MHQIDMFIPDKMQTGWSEITATVLSMAEGECMVRIVSEICIIHTCAFAWPQMLNQDHFFFNSC